MINLIQIRKDKAKEVGNEILKLEEIKGKLENATFKKDDSDLRYLMKNYLDTSDKLKSNTEELSVLDAKIVKGFREIIKDPSITEEEILVTSLNNRVTAYLLKVLQEKEQRIKNIKNEYDVPKGKTCGKCKGDIAQRR